MNNLTPEDWQEIAVQNLSNCRLCLDQAGDTPDAPLRLNIEGPASGIDLERLGIKKRPADLDGDPVGTGYNHTKRGLSVTGTEEIIALANAGVNFPGADKIRTQQPSWAQRPGMGGKGA